jgi:hypothetical protein
MPTGSAATKIGRLVFSSCPVLSCTPIHRPLQRGYHGRYLLRRFHYRIHPQMIAPLASPSQIPNISICVYLFVRPTIPSSYIIVVPSHAGYHRDITKTRFKQHEIVVILGNTRRKRRVRVAPQRKDAGRWSSPDNSSAKQTDSNSGEEGARPSQTAANLWELGLPG